MLINYGTLDQIAALKWIQKNDKAIVLSGANGGDLGTATLADAEALGLNFARRKGIADDDPQGLAKLRAMSAEDIVDGLNLSNSSGGDPPTFNPGGRIVDGKIVTHLPRAIPA